MSDKDNWKNIGEGAELIIDPSLLTKPHDYDEIQAEAAEARREFDNGVHVAREEAHKARGLRNPPTQTKGPHHETIDRRHPAAWAADSRHDSRTHARIAAWKRGDEHWADAGKLARVEVGNGRIMQTTYGEAGNTSKERR